MEGFENWCDVVKFSCPCKDPGSTVLNVLEFLDVFVGDPGKKSITVVQPGGDKRHGRVFLHLGERVMDGVLQCFLGGKKSFCKAV